MGAILFDIGGTHIRCAVLPHVPLSAPQTIAQVVKHKWDDLPVKNYRDTKWDKLIEVMTSYVTRHMHFVSPTDPVVISFPGPISQDGCPLAAPTIMTSNEAPPNIAAWLASNVGRRVFVLNDLSAAAWYVSTKTEVDRFLVVSISSGIGSKLFDRNLKHRVLDDSPCAGEIGHITVDHSPDAPLCDCGATGHLGAIASGRGIQQAAIRQARQDPALFSKSMCRLQFGAMESSIANELHLVPSILAGDSWAMDVLTHCTMPLAQTLAAITIATGLQKIFVTGGFAQSLGLPYINLLRSLLAKQASFTNFPFSDPNLVHISDFDEETCLLGAASYSAAKSQV